MQGDPWAALLTLGLVICCLAEDRPVLLWRIKGNHVFEHLNSVACEGPQEDSQVSGNDGDLSDNQRDKGSWDSVSSSLPHVYISNHAPPSWIDSVPGFPGPVLRSSHPPRDAPFSCLVGDGCSPAQPSGAQGNDGLWKSAFLKELLLSARTLSSFLLGATARNVLCRPLRGSILA